MWWSWLAHPRPSTSWRPFWARAARLEVTAISLEDQELRVLLDEDEEVAYGFDELDELEQPLVHHAGITAHIFIRPRWFIAILLIKIG